MMLGHIEVIATQLRRIRSVQSDPALVELLTQVIDDVDDLLVERVRELNASGAKVPESFDIHRFTRDMVFGMVCASEIDS